jgi:hypothetical protein
MYIRTSDGAAGLGNGMPLADPPKLSAADALLLRRAATLAAAMSKAVSQLGRALGYLATAAQQDLLREIIAILGVFLPKGYGVMDQRDAVLKPSARYRTEVIAKSPPRDVPFYFHHDTWLFLRHGKSTAAGMQRPFQPGHRNWVYLFPANLSSDVPTLARVLVHEMVHMLGHRYRSIEQKFGARVAGETPTAAAGALLNQKAFDPHRAVMERHFADLVAFLNRQPHRATGGSMAALPVSVAASWAAHLIEEVLAGVFTDRATLALARYEVSKRGAGISQELVPMEFLRTYFRTYWLPDARDAAALKGKGGDRVFQPMEADLLSLVAAAGKHIGP